jgi:chromatin segregation and condensation protein Rec8/ScpA/Scc1 (kleisin family)
MDVIRLAPLIRRLREQVESGLVPLEDSVRNLSYASELVLFKVRWLLPNPRAQEGHSEEEVLETGDSLAAATDLPVLEPWEVSEATSLLQEALEKAGARFFRGNAVSIGDQRRVVVSSIDPVDLKEAMLAVKVKEVPPARRIPLPRWSFLTHLRNFWREVRRVASRGGVLRFSRFLGESRMDAILNFLAFLELVRRRRLYARQPTLFGEIVFSPDRTEIMNEEVELS